MAKILVVEDDSAYSDVLEDWLLDEDHQVEVINDGLIARERLKLNDFDAIVLDWDLPGMSGVALCIEYRAQGGEVPILLLTGKTAIDEKEQGLDAGADDYLTKPFHLKELSARLRALLRRKASSRGLTPKQTPSVPDIQPESPEKLIGATIADRYQITGFLGEGGESVVYSGKHKLIDKPVAIKFLRSRFLTESRRVERFQREGEATSRLNHQNIVSMFDFGLIGSQPYLVMELIKGRSLAELLDFATALTSEQFVNFFVQVCDGLEHAHANGLLHRDLKPSNIMLIKTNNETEIVKLVDFGLAMLLPNGVEDSQRLTHPGEFVGTSYYMSPEQCRNKPMDARSDIYSLGCVMYESVTGLPPFMGEDVLATMQMHIAEEALPCHKTRTDIEISTALESLILKAIAKSPEQRFQSVTELKDAIMKTCNAN